MSATDTQPDDLDDEADTLRSQRLWKATAQQDLDFESQRLRNRLRERMFGVAAGPVSIGRFKVLETVGSGGMGVVYAAYDEELDRRVAVKLLRSRPGEGDSIGRSRLLREAQALAKLSHPHVVQVYEAGTFDDHVFVAMEFLSGLTMRAWLLEQPRPWKEVLAHFLAAGQGLAAAHRKGVIHRDFKPANLLFGADGRIRVVDFGLARAEGPLRAVARVEDARPPRSDHGDPSEPPAVERSRPFADELTQTGEIMGTPAYMSPEQACQERVDARSDQYSFCVALYEALFGRRPHQGRSPAEVLVAVAEGVVLPPPRNTRVPARVVRAIMRGLSAAPEQRFADMDALLAELRLDTGTRWRWLGLGGLAAAALIATAIATDDRDPCPSFEDSIEQAWGSSQQAALQSAFAASGAPGAAQVAEHVGAQLDAYASRWLGARHDVCEAHLVRRQESAQLHDTKVACLLERRMELGALAQAFAEADAQVLERAPEAVLELSPLASCSDASGMQARASDAPEDQALRMQLAEARAQYKAGRYPSALDLLDEVSTAAEQREAVAVQAEAQYERAVVQQHRRAFPAAIEALERAVELGEHAGADPLVARSWMLLALQHARWGDHAAAAQDLRLAGAKVRRLEDDGELHTTWLESRAVLAWYDGRYDEAIADERRVVERWGDLLEPHDPRRARSMKRLADFLGDAGQHQAATAGYDDVRPLYEQAFGPGHPQLARLELDVAILQRLAGRPDAAREHFEQAERMLRASLGPQAPDLLTVDKGLADLAFDRGDFGEAQRRAQQVLTLWSSLEGAPIGDRLDALAMLGMVASHRGQPERSLPFFREYLDVVASSPTPHDYRDQAVYTRVALAQSLAELGRPTEAADEARRALAAMGDGDEDFEAMATQARELIAASESPELSPGSAPEHGGA